MNQDYSKAVSFTNSYFALADGLVSGLENCLADNVVLDWFGKTIQGRANVSAFMNTHKVNSRHVFDEITPTNRIGYNKRNSQNKRLTTKIQSEHATNLNITIQSPLSKDNTPINRTITSENRSRSSSKISREINQESNLTFELHDDDLSTLFKLENIKSTIVEEIEEKLNQISLEEKLTKISPSMTNENVNVTENINIVRESSMKYVEAYGDILFSKKSRRQNNWSDCKLIPSNPTHTWRKPCQLKIAYSTQQIHLQQVLSANDNGGNLDYSSNFSETQQGLLSLDEITELSNHLVPNDNYFAGYLRNINLAKEEDSFFKNLSEPVSNSEAKKLGFVPCYINDQLVFQKTNYDNQYDYESKFVCNNLIHVIIYEGRSRCRMNLSQKFA